MYNDHRSIRLVGDVSYVIFTIARSSPQMPHSEIEEFDDSTSLSDTMYGRMKAFYVSRIKKHVTFNNLGVVLVCTFFVIVVIL